MRRLPGIAILLILLRAADAAPIVAGYVERARIDLPGSERAAVELKAKLDTGAANSSLDAREIEEFNRSGRRWVRFQVEPAQGPAVRVEAPLVRAAKVRRHEGVQQVRPVVRLRICLGSVNQEVEVNLIDRSGFNYPLLIGRSFLADRVLVDSGKRFGTRLDCG